MDLIWGLPAHPLTTHAPIVLIPLAALVAIGLAVSTRFRSRYDIALGGLAFFAAISTFLAKQSGEQLTERLGLEIAIEKHQDLAETTFLLTAAFALITLITVAAARLDATRNSTIVNSVLPVVCACLGVLATIWMGRTGHEGASLVWGNVAE